MSVKITFNGIDFEFKSEESITDKFAIEKEAVRLAGGYNELADLNSAIETQMRNYLKHCDEKFGEEGHVKMRQELSQLRDEGKGDTDEYRQKFIKLGDSKYFNTYLELTDIRDKIQNYARIKVLCLKKPPDYDFSKQSDKDISSLIRLLREEHNFFRTKTEENTEANPS